MREENLFICGSSPFVTPKSVEKAFNARADNLKIIVNNEVHTFRSQDEIIEIMPSNINTKLETESIWEIIAKIYNNKIKSNKIKSNKGIILDFRWPLGTNKLPVFFFNNRFTAQQIDLIQRTSNIWTKYSGISFPRVYSKRKAKIRITRHPGNTTNHSTTGIQACDRSSDNSTMHLGIFNKSIKIEERERERKRVILHEFGHALGYRHIHQNPWLNLEWNVSKIQEDLKNANYNWDVDKINEEIVERIPKKATSSTRRPDFKSVLSYDIPDHWYNDTNKESFSQNYELSPADKKSAQEDYQSFK